jgi:hypothetical protein
LTLANLTTKSLVAVIDFTPPPASRRGSPLPHA